MSTKPKVIPKPFNQEWIDKRIEIDPLRGCWLWILKRLTDSGYGRVYFKGYNYVAHRLFYEKLVGEIPDGLKVLHKCDIRLCVNPDHLWLGTSMDNSRDMLNKGRHISRTGKAQLPVESII